MRIADNVPRVLKHGRRARLVGQPLHMGRFARPQEAHVEAGGRADDDDLREVRPPQRVPSPLGLPVGGAVRCRDGADRRVRKQDVPGHRR
eukprot:13714390-Alexandrium_andersonii.AAC.1